MKILNGKIDIDEIKNILKNHSNVFCFGSRVLGKNSRFSDLGVCIKKEIGIMDLVRIKGKFEESNLPIKVDVSIYKDLLNFMKEKVDKNGVNLNDVKPE